MKKELYTKKIGFKRKEIKRRLTDHLENAVGAWTESKSIADIFVDAAIDSVEKDRNYVEKGGISFEKKYSNLEGKIQEYLGYVEGFITGEGRSREKFMYLKSVANLLSLENVNEETKISCIKSLQAVYDGFHSVVKEEVYEDISENILSFVKDGGQQSTLEAYLRILKETKETDTKFGRTYGNILAHNLPKLYLADLREKTNNVEVYLNYVDKLIAKSKEVHKRYFSPYTDPNQIVSEELPRLLLEGIEPEAIEFYIKSVLEITDSEQNIIDCYNSRHFSSEFAKQSAELLLKGADLKVLENYTDYAKNLDDLNGTESGRIAIVQLSRMFLNGESRERMDLYANTLKKIRKECKDVAAAAAMGIPKLFRELQYRGLKDFIDFGMSILKKDEEAAEYYFRLHKGYGPQETARKLLRDGYPLKYTAESLSNGV